MRWYRFGWAGESRLVAYVTSDAVGADEESAGQRQALTESLKSALGEVLPDYMVPSAYVMLDTLPLTPNGKADRGALPAPDMSQLQQVYVAPETETEKQLCAIWQEVLGLERVGVTDNFFELGALLLVMSVIGRASQSGLTVTARDVFTVPVIATGCANC